MKEEAIEELYYSIKHNIDHLDSLLRRQGAYSLDIKTLMNDVKSQVTDILIATRPNDKRIEDIAIGLSNAHILAYDNILDLDPAIKSLQKLYVACWKCYEI